MNIPKQPEESVFGDIGFTTKFRFSLVPCLSAMVTRSKSKFYGASLPNSRFFRLFRYKSWLALLLAPCLSFAAYPIYDNDDEEVAVSAVEQEAVENEESLQAQREEGESWEGETFAYEEDQQDESSNYSSKQQRISSPSSQETAYSGSRRSSTTAGKRSAKKRSSSVQESNRSSSKAQKSRQSSSRPRVTHRSQPTERSHQQPVEAELPSEEVEQAAKNESTSRSDRLLLDKKASAATQKRSARTLRQRQATTSAKAEAKSSGPVRKNYRAQAKAQQKRAKSHHPGKRPLFDQTAP